LHVTTALTDTQVLRECDTTRDFCHEQKQQAVAKKSLEVARKNMDFSEVLAGFRGLITKFREEFEFGFPSCQELRSLVSTLVIVRWVKFTTSFGMS